VLEDAFASGREPAAREEIFGNIAPTYDLLNDALSIGLHRAWKNKVVKLSGAKCGDEALDVCCGSGDLAFRLASCVGPSGKVSALDFSEDMLQRAKQREGRRNAKGNAIRKLSRRGRKRSSDARGGIGLASAPIDWIHGDALALPFPDGAFDCVTLGYGLRNVADRAGCLREIRRVLKRGGSAVVLDFNNPKGDATGGRAFGSASVRAKAVKMFRNFALGFAVVPVASAFGYRDEYRYLGVSIDGYPSGEELVEMATTEAGFTDAEFATLALGLMGILVLRKE